MIGSKTAIMFPLQKIASGDDEFGGMPPFFAAYRPPVGITPFGRTDSDIKGPTIPKPILLPVLRKLQFVSKTKVKPLPATVLRIFGITKNGVTNVAIGGCAVDLFETISKRYVASTVSDGSGNYEFRSASLSTAYQVVAYLPGSPDIAGVTLNTLVGVL